MNTIRNIKVREQDFTNTKRKPSKRIATLSDSGGLFFTLGGSNVLSSDLPKLRKPFEEK